MYIVLSLISFFITSEIVFTSYKPPLQVINYNVLPIKNLDTELNVRPWTIVDALSEALEDAQLTTEQKEQLKKLNTQQDEIVASYKTFYQALIDEEKELEFNRSKIICQTIANYRRVIKNKIDKDLKEKVEAFYQSLNISSSRLTMAQAENTMAQTKNESRRRQRSED